MKGARIVAIAATIGNLLQGWDSAMLAGALLYIEPEFNLDVQPVLEGSVVAASLAGAAISTAIAGSGADWLGRRKILSVAAFICCLGALLMVWSPNVYTLLLARVIDGVGVGLAVTVVPMYISEIAPSEIRGELNTYPQFTGSTGMFLAYCVSFGISMSSNASWRLMLGILLIPSVAYLMVGLFYLPESPRWLVSKGQMREARQVLQVLRNREDVSGEMALLVEGLGVGQDATFEEYIIEPAEDEGKGFTNTPKDPYIKIIGLEDGTPLIARPISSITGSQRLLSRMGSLGQQAASQRPSIPLMDPLVPLFGSIKGTLAESFVGFGSMASIGQGKHFDNFEDGNNDEANGGMPEEAPQYESDGDYGENNLRSPLLLSRQTTGQWDEEDQCRTDSPFSRISSLQRGTPKGYNPIGRSSGFSRNNFQENAAPYGSLPGSVGSTGIGGGWNLAWQWTGPEGTEGKLDQGEFKRIYLFQEGPLEEAYVGSKQSLPRYGSTVSAVEPMHAAALVTKPSQYGKNIELENQVGPALVHPAETAKKGPAWSELLQGGVRQALIVGVSLQILETFAGINAVLNFTPKILQQSGADVLLSGIGISSDSAPLLSSAVVQLIALPCILVAMQLMDKLGRRFILLRTIPVLFIALLTLIIINIIPASDAVFAAVSIVGVIVYISVFVMGFGPIPNMLCAEIFPTRARGVCIGICQATMWVCNILVTELFPLLDESIGIAGSFAFFAVFCLISWIFIFLKVPETKGMPLEVIVEFFAMSAAGKKIAAPKE
ncbi:hypothetical protein KP509_25G004100 [Ceratopteris richardii]|uniref:Major facilitator superfamily (MFS) profile domain-containing protein n=1 Tax=Ceratopteris richardii TaxID=49495 RepID=A0A8T2RMI4_CERRI|nr:hypothetical protein KP509_25G004100 [Ceratopteris richardii]